MSADAVFCDMCDQQLCDNNVDLPQGTAENCKERENGDKNTG